VTYKFTDYCLCPQCRAELIEEDVLRCQSCNARYEIRKGIPILMAAPLEVEARQLRYLRSYEGIAQDDLKQPLEQHRDARHSAFLKFIGNIRGRRVLDIGSSHALYLAKLTADFKVALDIAFPYLDAIPSDHGIARICGDAERLPFKPRFFDVIIISDILEHILNPEKLLDSLRVICRPDTRIFVHVPWEEDLEQYKASPYEFSHLRSFNGYDYGNLWKGFYIRRSRCSFPHMKYPLLFRLEGKIPQSIYNVLVSYYFYSPVFYKRDLEWRTARTKALPKGERWLLWFFKPVFKMFEMRRYGRIGFFLEKFVFPKLDRMFWKVS
jgi:SAM-dependent methyltransferase